MNFKELVERRFSVRKYEPREVEREKLEYVLECARLAPSACNRQPWRFVVVRDRAMLRRLGGCYDREWFATAPVCIVACAADGEAWHRASDGKNHADIDVAIAVEHICLAAAEQGLGTCWICNFDCVKCDELLALPEGVRSVAMIPLGYPALAATAKSRKAPEAVVKEISEIE